MQVLKTSWIVVFFAVLALTLSGCPKDVPQPEIDAAEDAIANLEKTKDCAPETYQAAKTTMDRARALLKEERYEEAKTALIAAKKLADKAAEECEKKRKQDAEEEAARKRQAEIDAQNAAKALEASKDVTTKGPAGMLTIHFGFNNSDLTDEARETLTNNSDYIRNHPGIRVQLEGHCDSRGSTEYNLALGERRALAVKQYLVKSGVDPNQLEIISFGEERMVDGADNDDAHAQNRRAEFKKLQ